MDAIKQSVLLKKRGDAMPIDYHHHLKSSLGAIWVRPPALPFLYSL